MEVENLEDLLESVDCARIQAERLRLLAGGGAAAKAILALADSVEALATLALSEKPQEGDEMSVKAESGTYHVCAHSVVRVLDARDLLGHPVKYQDVQVVIRERQEEGRSRVQAQVLLTSELEEMAGATASFACVNSSLRNLVECCAKTAKSRGYYPMDEVYGALVRAEVDAIRGRGLL